MPFHAGLIAGVVTGAVNGVVGLIADRAGAGRSGQGTEIDPATGVVVTALPTIMPGAAPIEAGGVGGIIPVIGAVAGTIIRRVAGPAAVIGGIGTVVSGITGGGDAQPTTRRQAILQVARAANPGATAKKIIRSARECGIELAAATFGLSILDVCFLIAQPPTRRSRGISAADMRRTRSTIRKVTTIQKQLKALSGPPRRR